MRVPPLFDLVLPLLFCGILSFPSGNPVTASVLIQNFPVGASDYKCMCIQLSIAHKLLVNVFLANSFGSKIELSSGHYIRTLFLCSGRIMARSLEPKLVAKKKFESSLLCVIDNRMNAHLFL